MNDKYLPVFVYGTLLVGEPNHRLVAGAVTRAETGVAAGFQLRDAGGFPYAVRADADGQVHGQLLWLDPAQYDDAMRRLDLLEGYEFRHPEWSHYLREQHVILTVDGSVRAWLYVAAGDKSGLPLIACGDWLARAATVR